MIKCAKTSKLLSPKTDSLFKFGCNCDFKLYCQLKITVPED